MLLPTTGKFLMIGILGMLWIAFCRQAMRLDANKAFHLASYQRDRRKARFYYLSIWIGLASAFLSLASLEAVGSLPFETSSQRDWASSLLRGVGMWGLGVIGMVWSQVGQRVSLPNSDGQSLVPVPEQKQNRN